jgi:hypothetical protein
VPLRFAYPHFTNLQSQAAASFGVRPAFLDRASEVMGSPTFLAARRIEYHRLFAIAGFYLTGIQGASSITYMM